MGNGVYHKNMGTEEMESVIVLNFADKNEGFFIFSTSVKAERDRFVKRVGEDNILEEKVWRNGKGVQNHWTLKVDIRMFNRETFEVRLGGVKTARSAPRGGLIPENAATDQQRA